MSKINQIYIPSDARIHLSCRRTGDGVMIDFANISSNGCVHIDALPETVPDMLTCPACAQQVSAVRGKKVAHHFRHRSRTACENAGETMAHKLAKKIIEEAGYLRLPAVVARGHLRTEVLHDARTHPLERITLETHLGNMVPDVMAHIGARTVLIEIHVTHPVGAEKKKKIRDQGIAALEIDVSKLARSACSYEDLKRAILEKANRKWIYNPKADERSRDMREHDRAHLKALHSRFTEPVPLVNRQLETIIDTARTALRGVGFEAYLRGHSKLDGAFTGSPGDWRTLLLADILGLSTGSAGRQKSSTGEEDRQISTKDALTLLRSNGLVKSPFGKPMDHEIKTASALGFEIDSAWRSVEGFLTALHSTGVLGWPDATGKIWPILQQGSQLQESARKLEENLTVMISAHRYATSRTPVFRSSGREETTDTISQMEWLQAVKFNSSMRSRDHSILAALESARKACHPPYDPADPEKLESAGISIATDVLQKLRTEHLAKEGRERGEEIERLARDLLGDGADAFLDAPGDRFRGSTLRKQAVRNRFGLDHARRKIEQECAANKAEAELVGRATDAFGTTKAEEFLASITVSRETVRADVRRRAMDGDPTIAKTVVDKERSRRLAVVAREQERLRAWEAQRIKNVDTLRNKFGMNDPNRFNVFLNSQHPALGNRRPRELCETAAGYDRCFNLAQRLNKKRAF